MSWILSLLVGLGTGILSSMGVGGGSLLVLWMTAAQNAAPETARAVNLLFFLPTAGIGLLFHGKHGLVRWRVVLPAAAAGCLCAMAAALLSARLDPDLLRRSFGFFLVLTGLRELETRPENSA